MADDAITWDGIGGLGSPVYIWGIAHVNVTYKLPEQQMNNKIRK